MNKIININILGKNLKNLEYDNYIKQQYSACNIFGFKR